MSKDKQVEIPVDTFGAIDTAVNVGLEQYSQEALDEQALIKYEAEAAANISGEGPLEFAERYARPGFKLRLNNNWSWSEAEKNRKLGYTDVIGTDNKPVTMKDGDRLVVLQEIPIEKWKILQKVTHQMNLAHEANTISPAMKLNQPEGQYNIKQSAHYRAISYRRMPNGPNSN